MTTHHVTAMGIAVLVKRCVRNRFVIFGAGILVGLAATTLN